MREEDTSMTSLSWSFVIMTSFYLELDLVTSRLKFVLNPQVLQYENSRHQFTRASLTNVNRT